MAFANINNIYPKPSTGSGATVIAGQSVTCPGSSSVATITTAFSGFSNLVFLDVQTADVIVTFDNATPVAGTTGHRLYAGTNYTWSTATAHAAKFIAATSSTAFIYVTEFQV
jgi:hypothetical protein